MSTEPRDPLTGLPQDQHSWEAAAVAASADHVSGHLEHVTTEDVLAAAIVALLEGQDTPAVRGLLANADALLGNVAMEAKDHGGLAAYMASFGETGDA